MKDIEPILCTELGASGPRRNGPWAWAKRVGHTACRRLLACCVGIAAHAIAAPIVLASTTLVPLSSPMVSPSPATTSPSSGTSSGTTSTVPSSNPAPEMAIGIPTQGAALYDTSSWYDASTGLIRVRGNITNVPRSLINSGSFQIILDGQYPVLSVTANATKGRILFEGETPALVLPTWVKRTVLAELVDTTTSNVVARDYVTYFDLRVADEASPEAPYGPIAGMAAQLTDPGLGQTPFGSEPSSLEVPHLQSLPYPALADFNEALADAAQALPPDAGASEIEACINLADAVQLEPNLTNTAEYLAIYGLAAGYYAGYEAFQETQSCAQLGTVLGAANPFLGIVATLGCELAMSTYCVKELPQVEDFELCVGEVQLDPTSLNIDGVDDVTLGFVNSGSSDGARIGSGYSVDGVSGQLNGLVRGLSFRWSDDSCSAPPPQTRISDTRLHNGDWLEDFTTCEDIRIDASSAATSEDTEAEFQVTGDGDGGEALRVRLAQSGAMELIDPEVSVGSGLCAEPFLVDDTEALALGYQQAFEDTLNDTWNSIGSFNHQAQALEVLLGRLNLGVPAHARYGLSAEFQKPLSSLPLEGTQFIWDTQVLELKDGVEVAPYLDSVFYHPALPAPYFETARNDHNEPFDLSFNITTGYLNQLLHIQSKDLLNFSYQPTWDELAAVGVTAPTGQPGDAPATLDGTTLGQIDPSFSVLGTAELAVEIKATLDPVVWMHPDPPSFMENPSTGVPLAYGIGGMEVRFTEIASSSPTSVPGREWLRLKLNFLDPDVGLIMGLERPNHISLNMLNDDWAVAVEASLFNGCPMVPHGVWEPPASCERTLEQTLLPLFLNLLRDRFVDMLSDIQSPQVFEAGWNNAVSFDVGRVWKFNQNITFYGDIPDY